VEFDPPQVEFVSALTLSLSKLWTRCDPIVRIAGSSHRRADSLFGKNTPHRDELLIEVLADLRIAHLECFGEASLKQWDIRDTLKTDQTTSITPLMPLA